MLHHRHLLRQVFKVFTNPTYSATKEYHMALPDRQVVVIGSGFAGLSAAYEAVKAGAPVRMLERGPKPGGNSIKASSGINGAGTLFQNQHRIYDTPDNFYQDSVKSAGKSLKENEQHRTELIRTLVDRSAAEVKWLTDEIGIDLSVVAPLGGHSVARTHRGAGKLPPGAAIVTTLLKKLELNPLFKLITSAEATALIVENGAVRGVEYRDENGVEKLLGPVVVAAGGFAGDSNGMLAKYRPDLAGVPSTNENRPGPHGLLSSVGAEMMDMSRVQIHPTGFVDPKDPLSAYKFLAAEMLRGEGGILLYDGQRFVNELETREVVSNAIMKQKPTSQSTKQWNVTLLLDPGACEAAGSHLGFYQFKGLMEKKKVGELDAQLITAVDRYAQVVASGKDDLGRTNFGRWRLKPGETNRNEEVCIGHVTVVTHFTMGGAAFNTEAQVLRRDDAGQLVPIPGLWAAGEITGGIHGDNRLGGSSLLECSVFGREAGRQAASSLL
ncbi:FAD binding domain-containing protein [Stachybotrys elegans]|uniref:Fumarate reductase n=1 Tax=Stachybotrys elegans TaxID=80388 RepID=A0A8K0SXU4_9HYPO|nr:FAD binding domain-containing protein [Stachybotrys elegans]